MTGIYDPPTGTRPQWAPPGTAPPYGRPGPGGPGGPYGPYGYGGGRPGGRGPGRRLGRRVLVLCYVLVIAVASFWGLQHARVHQQAHQHAQSSGHAAAIAARVDPGLVDIVTTLGLRRAAAAGTGMVLTSSGEVLTNNHVIEGATSIRVRDVGNGRSYRATVAGYDRSHDVALLKLSGASGLPTVRTCDSSRASVGEPVVAIGNAGGRGGTPSVVSGRIVRLNASVTATDASAGTSERLRGLIGHNAPIKPGDSGGPLVNQAGCVIGINTAASSGPRGFELRGGTRAFAVPITQALSIASQIESSSGSASVHIGATAFLGVGVLSAKQAQARGFPIGRGVAIASVFPGTAASKAGLTAGDMITSVDNRRVTTPEVLQSELGQHHPGDSVRIGWLSRDGQAHSAIVTLQTGPAG